MFNKLHSGLCPCTTGKHLQPSNIYSLLKEDLSRNQKKRSITSSVTFYSFCLTHTNLVMRLQNHYVHPRTFSVPPLLLILWLSAIKLPFSDQNCLQPKLHWTKCSVAEHKHWAHVHDTALEKNLRNPQEHCISHISTNLPQLAVSEAETILRLMARFTHNDLQLTDVLKSLWNKMLKHPKYLVSAIVKSCT